MNRQKSVFIWILIVFTLLLVFLPLVLTFNNFVTKLVEQNLFYRWIAIYIVPIEARIMGVILIFLGYSFAFSPSNSFIMVNGVNMGLTWNCLGWQSFLLFLVTLMVGYRLRYTKNSIFLAIGIGLFGTFWVNIARMIFTILLAVHLQPVFRIVFHDYLAAIVTVVWLFFFWWFSYRFVLEERIKEGKSGLSKEDEGI